LIEYIYFLVTVSGNGDTLSQHSKHVYVSQIIRLVYQKYRSHLLTGRIIQAKTIWYQPVGPMVDQSSWSSRDLRPC